MKPLCLILILSLSVGTSMILVDNEHPVCNGLLLSWNGGDLYEVHLDQGTIRKLFSTTRQIRFCSVSPDGTQLALVLYQGTRPTRLTVVDLNDKSVRAISDSFIVDGCHWDQDGQSLFFLGANTSSKSSIPNVLLNLYRYEIKDSSFHLLFELQEPMDGFPLVPVPINTNVTAIPAPSRSSIFLFESTGKTKEIPDLPASRVFFVDQKSVGLFSASVVEIMNIADGTRTNIPFRGELLGSPVFDHNSGEIYIVNSGFSAKTKFKILPRIVFDFPLVNRLTLQNQENLGIKSYYGFASNQSFSTKCNQPRNYSEGG